MGKKQMYGWHMDTPLDKACFLCVGYVQGYPNIWGAYKHMGDVQSSILFFFFLILNILSIFQNILPLTFALWQPHFQPAAISCPIYWTPQTHIFGLWTRFLACVTHVQLLLYRLSTFLVTAEIKCKETLQHLALRNKCTTHSLIHERPSFLNEIGGIFECPHLWREKGTFTEWKLGMEPFTETGDICECPNLKWDWETFTEWGCVMAPRFILDKGHLKMPHVLHKTWGLFVNAPSLNLDVESFKETSYVYKCPHFHFKLEAFIKISQSHQRLGESMNIPQP